MGERELPFAPASHAGGVGHANGRARQEVCRALHVDLAFEPLLIGETEGLLLLLRSSAGSPDRRRVIRVYPTIRRNRAGGGAIKRAVRGVVPVGVFDPTICRN
jgi:hypothetical protein